MQDIIIVVDYDNRLKTKRCKSPDEAAEFIARKAREFRMDPLTMLSYTYTLGSHSLLWYKAILDRVPILVVRTP